MAKASTSGNERQPETGIDLAPAALRSSDGAGSCTFFLLLSHLLLMVLGEGTLPSSGVATGGAMHSIGRCTWGTGQGEMSGGQGRAAASVLLAAARQSEPLRAAD